MLKVIIAGAVHWNKGKAVAWDKPGTKQTSNTPRPPVATQKDSSAEDKSST